MLFSRSQNSAPSKTHRVVVTGAGVITALGAGWKLNAAGFRAGRKAFRPVTLFDVSGQRAKSAAEIDLPSELPKTLLSTKAANRLDRAGRFLLIAAHECWTQAGWNPGENIPVMLGTTSGAMSCGEEYLVHAISKPSSQRKQATRVMQYQLHRQGLELCNAFGFAGTVTVISNACASGSNAIGHAFQLIRGGAASRVFTGGYDAICRLTFAGFDSLQALSTTTCRPFDAARDGLTLGEGAAMLALESLENAQKRGAEILGEIIGYGATTDIHHLTQPHPNGDAALGAMNAACAMAGVTPEQVDYVNAHGTATPQNDVTEAAAINRWAGARAASLPVSSTKASIGHLLGAAGAVEAVVCLMALQGQWQPPETAIGTVDPACHFKVVREPTDAKLEIALSNSFGFGGANATLVMRRWT